MLYSRALEVMDKDDAAMHKVLLGNRSACNIGMGQWETALEDCLEVVDLDDQWTKAHFRLGQAYEGLKDYEQGRFSFVWTPSKSPSFYSSPSVLVLLLVFIPISRNIFSFLTPPFFAARGGYNTALKLDSKNKSAKKALKKLDEKEAISKEEEKKENKKEEKKEVEKTVVVKKKGMCRLGLG